MIFLVFAALTSCDDYIGGDLNADPNSPTSLPVTAQMPAFHIALADVYGGDFSRFSTMLIQQAEGVARQWSSFNQYTGLTPNRFDSAWQNVYENILNEIKIARASATISGFNHHLGILDITEAITIMIATDVWDSMPYTDALQGVGNTSPAYDSQTTIYTAVQTLLASGISKLQGPAGGISPGGEDVFFGGDVQKWINTAGAFKARWHLHRKEYSQAISEAAAYSTAADNMAYQYPDANAAGGWYRFNRDRTGDLEFHPTMRDLLVGDPTVPGDLGLNDSLRYKSISGTFITTHTYMVPNFLQEMITYREMQFIIAESALRMGGMDAVAHAAYLEGIEASFVRMGVPIADAMGAIDPDYQTYITQNSVDPGVGNLTLEHVMTQKYIAMYLQPEAYADWRRTSMLDAATHPNGIPALTPVSGTSVPVRFDYGSQEYLFNSSAPSEGSVNIFTDRVNWNQ